MACKWTPVLGMYIYGQTFLCFLITHALNPSKCVRTCENFCSREIKTVAKVYQKWSERCSSCW